MRSIQFWTALACCTIGLGLGSLTYAYDSKDVKTTAPATAALAPHGIVIQTALQSAMDDVKGLKALVNTAKNAPKDKELVSHLTMLEKKVDSDINMAATHQAELVGAAKEFPKIAKTDGFIAANEAIDSVKTLSTAWRSAATKHGYWDNVGKVNTDLDNFEKQLALAVERTRDFNSDQLKAQVPG